MARWASQQVARRDLTDGAKLVLLAMAEHVRDERAVCWPSLDRLAAMTGRSRQGTKNAIDALVLAGLVAVENRADDAGRSTSNLYRLALTQGPELGPSQGPVVGPSRGQNLAPEVRTNLEPVQVTVPRARGTNLLTASPEDLRAVWNQGRGHLPEWRVLSPAQADHARRRLAELPLERWPEVVRAMALSPFCVAKGLGPSFFLKPDTWARALNGEIASWGALDRQDRRALKRRIDASGGDDHLAEAMRAGMEDDGGL